MGALTLAERKNLISRSPFQGRYEKTLDRESAYELLKIRAQQQLTEDENQKKAKPSKGNTKSSKRRQSAGEALLKSAARSIGSQIGRQIVRGIMGSLLGGRR
jgi:hypothetical protein